MCPQASDTNLQTNMESFKNSETLETYHVHGARRQENSTEPFYHSVPSATLYIFDIIRSTKIVEFNHDPEVEVPESAGHQVCVVAPQL